MQNCHMASWDHFYSFRVLFVILELNTLVDIAYEHMRMPVWYNELLFCKLYISPCGVYAEKVGFNLV